MNGARERSCRYTVVVAVHFHPWTIFDEPGRLLTGVHLGATLSAIAVIFVGGLRESRALCIIELDLLEFGLGRESLLGGVGGFRRFTVLLLLKVQLQQHANSDEKGDGDELAHRGCTPRM
jgi:hypothetical protein